MKHLALAILLLIPMAANAEAPAQPYISVTGEATAKVVPDKATLQVTAQGDDKQLAVAKESANKKLKNVLDVAKKFGIEGDKLKTSFVQVQPRYRYVQQSGKQVLEGYTASTSLELTLIDISKLGNLMDALVEAGVDQVSGAQFGLIDEKKSRDEMLAKAVQDARSKAEKLAAAAGVKVGKAMAISDSGGGVQPPMPMMRMARADMEMAQASPELPSGLIEVRQNVSVTFALE